MNVNIGGTLKWPKVHPDVRAKWKVLDLIGEPDFVHDLNSGDPLPFLDNTVNNFYSSHTLEHVRHWLVVPLLVEMRRCLKAGGKIRIVVPDIVPHILAYVQHNESWQKGGYKKRISRELYPNTCLGTLMGYFYNYVKDNRRDGHHMAFDIETLLWCATEAGFTQVSEKQYGNHSPIFAGMDFNRHKGKSLYIEATNG